MRSSLVSAVLVALAVLLPGGATRVEAGVVNVGVDGMSQAIPDRVIGLQYKIHVDDVDLVTQDKIIFGAVRFHNSDVCGPGACRLYQLETTLHTKRIAYTDVAGCPSWPDTDRGPVSNGTSVLVNLIDHDRPRVNALGIRPIDPATLAAFPRQSVGVDDTTGLTRIASWSQMDVTGKTIHVLVIRGAVLDVPSGVDALGWGHRFEPEPPGGYPPEGAACVAELPDGRVYRLWRVLAIVDGVTYGWDVALPENDAKHLSVGRLEFGTEFFEHAETFFSARYFDVEYFAEGGTSWTPVTRFKVVSREENRDLCEEPDILTSYGWGARKRLFGAECTIEFSNDGESNDYYAASDTFELDGACTELSDPGPPDEPPSPPLPTGANLAEGKTATQSSTLGGNPDYIAAKAVDGVDNCEPPGGFTHTAQDDRAWWQVDLGAPALVSRVALFNRKDCCQARLTEYDVILSETPFPASPVNPSDYTFVSRNEEVGRFEEVAISGMARYVRVQLRSPSEYLQLAEVQVYADCNGVQTDPWEQCDGEMCCTAECQYATGTSCDDGDACTEDDTCTGDGLACAGTPVDCDDGNVCNGGETCTPATGCQPGTPLACDDGNACNGSETCNPTTGCQAGTPPSCNDGNACNGVETCDPLLGCQPGTPLACNDGNVCNGMETCSPLTGCQTGTPLACSDGNACSGTETCHPLLGCQAGTPLDCDDGNVCTTDSCSAGACQHVNNELACNDGSPCTRGDICFNGVCQASLLVSCPDVDQNPNTWEHCDVATGDCIQTPIGQQAGTLCGNGVLNPNWGEQCDDGNRVSGDCCSSTCKLEGPYCEDGNPCTFADTCQGGALDRHCVPGGCRAGFSCAEICGEGVSCQGAGGCQCLE